ncbi:hypothetical protein OG206_05530 [Streptomyces sp. NBC_01341]|uniref:hypothetical protein n=1 Tax=Streptomyces sp. NBC_01341 TaxID=2903831 RepID=UPI002E14615B|nr:hypothetical protein OG206_05530 [Streptomyces sp. NBC_01341]
MALVSGDSTFDEYGNTLDSSAVAPADGSAGTSGHPILSAAPSSGSPSLHPSDWSLRVHRPVDGDNSDAYTYPSAPVNELDLTGRLKFPWHYYGLRIRFNKHATVQVES